MERQAAPTERHEFDRLMGNVDKWATIDDIVGMCDAEEFWSPDFLNESQSRAKKQHIRRLIKQSKDEGGWPVWASVETQDENGNTVRVYKQETLFDVSDYKQAAAYHSGIAKHHHAMASGYARRCKRRFNKSIQLRFA